MFRYRYAWLTVVACAAWVLCACALAQADQGLTQVHWKLVECDGAEVPVEAVVTAVFEDGQVSGSSGVNRYSAFYAAKAEGLQVGRIASTMMAGPEDLMALERAFLAALQGVTTYRVREGRLELLDAAGTSRLAFVSNGQPRFAAFEKVRWHLETCNSGPVPTDAVLTADLYNGKITGFAGINRYSGDYWARGWSLQVTALVSTRMAGPEGLMQFESAFLEALTASRGYRLVGDRLELIDATGLTRLVFVAAADEGQQVRIGAPAERIEGLLWVPLRPMVDWLGAEVEWDETKQVATVTRGTGKLIIEARKNVAHDAVARWTASYRMLRPSGLLHVPLEAVISAFGCRAAKQAADHVLIIADDGRLGRIDAKPQAPE